MTERITVLSVGRVRATWPRDVARWSTAGLLPVNHHPCLSPDELDSRVAEVGGVDVVLVDGGMASVGRDLIRRAAAGGSAVVVIDDDERDWLQLGATSVMAAPTGPDALARTLDQLRPTAWSAIPSGPPNGVDRARGTVIAVIGHGGSGTSTIAHALALRWGHSAPGGRVLLADFSRRADQHVHHNLTEPGPGLLDLVSGQHRATMDADAVRLCTRPTGSEHRILTGLRHRRDWTALVPSGVTSALRGLRGAFETVVIDTDDDVDGRAETGSIDLEERNVLSRAAVSDANCILVVARGDLLGLNRLCALINALSGIGVDPERIRVVINGTGRRTPPTPALRRDLAALLEQPDLARRVAVVAHQRSLEGRRRDGRGPSPRFLRGLASLDELLLVEPLMIATGEPLTPALGRGQS